MGARAGTANARPTSVRGATCVRSDERAAASFIYACVHGAVHSVLERRIRMCRRAAADGGDASTPTWPTAAAGQHPSSAWFVRSCLFLLRWRGASVRSSACCAPSVRRGSRPTSPRRRAGTSPSGPTGCRWTRICAPPRRPALGSPPPAERRVSQVERHGQARARALLRAAPADVEDVAAGTGERLRRRLPQDRRRRARRPRGSFDGAYRRETPPRRTIGRNRFGTRSPPAASPSTTSTRRARSSSTSSARSSSRTS